MPNPSPSSIRVLTPAAFSALLPFLPVFVLTYFADKQHLGWGMILLPNWIAALIGATVFALPVGTAVAILTRCAQGKEHRIDQMLDGK